MLAMFLCVFVLFQHRFRFFFFFREGKFKVSFIGSFWCHCFIARLLERLFFSGDLADVTHVFISFVYSQHLFFPGRKFKVSFMGSLRSHCFIAIVRTLLFQRWPSRCSVCLCFLCFLRHNKVFQVFHVLLTFEFLRGGEGESWGSQGVVFSSLFYCQTSNIFFFFYLRSPSVSL